MDLLQRDYYYLLDEMKKKNLMEQYAMEKTYQLQLKRKRVSIKITYEKFSLLKIIITILEYFYSLFLDFGHMASWGDVCC